MQHATFFPVVTDSLLPYIDSFSPHNSFYTHNEFKNESVVVGQMTRW